MRIEKHAFSNREFQRIGSRLLPHPVLGLDSITALKAMILPKCLPPGQGELVPNPYLWEPRVHLCRFLRKCFANADPNAYAPNLGFTIKGRQSILLLHNISLFGWSILKSASSSKLIEQMNP